MEFIRTPAAFFWLSLLLSGFLSPGFGQGNLPPTPEMIRVHVDHSDGGVWVEWEAVEDTSVDVYWVHKMDNGTSLDRLFQVPKEVLKQKVPRHHGSEDAMHLSYAVTAMDTLAGNESLLGANEHRAVSLEVEYELCEEANQITWTPYKGWEGQVAGYRIYGGVSGDSLVHLSTRRAIDTLYLHEDVTPGVSYTYFVEAVKNNGVVSHSPLENVSSTYPSPPSFLRIDHVSVNSKQTVEIQVSVDTDGPIQDFKLMRQTPDGTSWKEVGRVEGILQSPFLMEDQVVTALQHYRYRVEAIFSPEGCSHTVSVSISDTGNNILLQGQGENSTALLQWNPYEGFERGVAEYRIYRNAGYGDFEEAAVLTPGSTSWQEDLDGLLNGIQKGEVVYRVAAVSHPGTDEQTHFSYSNEEAVTIPSQIRLPNAFTPGTADGNELFRPLFDFAPEDYRMEIYDRTGRKLFSTSDPTEGWDGSNGRGRFVMEGVYIYHIQFTDYTGKDEVLTGNVTVFYL